MNTGTEIVPATQQQFSVPELSAIAKNVAASKLFAGAETEQAAFTLMLLCQAEGLHPIQAMRRYHIIKGRPSMRADAMQAEFQRHGGVIRWDRSDGAECVARFIHPVHAPDPGVTIGLTMAKVVEAGLSTDMYKKFPDQMLRARVISQGVRMVLPGVVVGIYTPEEADALDLAPADRPAPGPDVPLDSRAAVNGAFRPAGSAPEPGPPAREKVRLSGDRIGDDGRDGRPWHRLLEEEVGTANAAASNRRRELQLEDRESGACRPIETSLHILDEAVRQEKLAPPEGKPNPAQVVKLLVKLYGRDGEARDWMRRELKRHLKGRVQDAWARAENEAAGDGALLDAEHESQEPPVGAEDLGQEPATAGVGDDGWAPGRE